MAKRERAELLRKSGKSYAFIKEELRIPASTLSYWFKNKEWSKKVKLDIGILAKVNSAARMKLLNEVRAKKLENHYALAAEEAEHTFHQFHSNPLFIAGLMLYLGEGDKSLKNHLVRISNAEARVLRIFLRFLYKFCAIDRKRVRFWMLLYPDLDEQEAKKDWKQKLNLEDGHFYKTQVIKGLHKERRLAYGVGNVIIGGKYLKVKILRWIDLACEKLNADMV